MHSLALFKPFHVHGLFRRHTREASPFDFTAVHLDNPARGGDKINSRTASRLAIIPCQNVPTSSMASLSVPTVVPDDQADDPQARPCYPHAANVFLQFCQVVIYSAHCVTWSGGGFVGCRRPIYLCSSRILSVKGMYSLLRRRNKRSPSPADLPQLSCCCSSSQAFFQNRLSHFFPSSPKYYITPEKRENHGGATALASLIHVF